MFLGTKKQSQFAGLWPEIRNEGINIVDLKKQTQFKVNFIVLRIAKGSLKKQSQLPTPKGVEAEGGVRRSN